MDGSYHTVTTKLVMSKHQMDLSLSDRGWMTKLCANALALEGGWLLPSAFFISIEKHVNSPILIRLSILGLSIPESQLRRGAPPSRSAQYRALLRAGAHVERPLANWQTSRKCA